MSLTLYAHPFAAYSWKVLIALYENGTSFTWRVVDSAEAVGELESLWPLKKFPVLKDGEKVLIESSVIVEYLSVHHPGAARLMPEGLDIALDVRFMDRVFDNYVMTPMQKIVADRLRGEGERDAKGIAEARALLDTAYAWLEKRLGVREWAAGEVFSLADCAAAPALFYADWVHPIGAQFRGLRGYRARLLARASIARVVEEARPYRHFFPGGAPDRD
jgi:glutathione S-transferase